jgi:hypothetical protein
MWCKLRHYLGNCLEELKKPVKTFNQDNIIPNNILVGIIIFFILLVEISESDIFLIITPTSLIQTQ